MHSRSPAGARLCALLAFPALAVAQGAYVNFETPQVKPITMAVVGGTEYLLVCNTPDSAVEIYDPNTASPLIAPVYVDRVPVGQGPASVRFDAETACFYTANYIGDSVTKVQLAKPASTLLWTLVATKPAGESPADLALSADGTELYVTLADASRLATLDAATLDPIGTPVTMTRTTAQAQLALKEPRRIEVRGTERWVLNMKGGNLHSPHQLQPPIPIPPPPSTPPYDFDLWAFDSVSATARTAGGVGTTNAGMAFGDDGRLYVVGSMARNDVNDEPALKLLAQGRGFVESWLWVMNPTTSTPSVLSARDLNLDHNGALLLKPNTCSQPFDVALMQDDGAVSKVYIAAFGSDRLVVLTTNAGLATTWPRSLVDLSIPPPLPVNDYTRNGPRGLAFNAAQTRLYVMNLLSNSVSVVDVSNDTHAVRFPLQWDMTSRVVREARQFLYSDAFSANGTVACSSCHVDARGDSLGWDLGTPLNGPVQQPVGLNDTTNPNTTAAPHWAADKGIMVTQSLQGLVNHPANVAAQDMISNKPYHWRGDRADFLAFKPAFVDLMGGAGITDPEMVRYRDFINTVMYTPNPEQAPNRVLRGELGDPNDLSTGSDAMRGMKVFFTESQNRCNGRSCGQCHFAPEGSNNKITTAPAGGLETAALRSLFQREGRVEAFASAHTPGQSNLMSSHFGLSHDGHAHGPVSGNPFLGIVVDGAASIDRFILDSFGPFTADPNRYGRFEDLAEFCREFDAGIAPAVGVTYTVTFANKAAAATTSAFALLERQVAFANIGLAVHARVGNVKRGYWFDITGASPVYREHGTSNTYDRANLLSQLLTTDVLVLQGTPAGSERRIASLDGHPAVIPGPAPANVVLQPLRPATHWANVPLLTANWDPHAATFPFVFNPPAGQITPLSLTSVRLMQRGLLQFGSTLGLPNLRHEAPRRFVVSGDDIRVGARLQFRIPAAATPPPYTDVNANTLLLELGLYPTTRLFEGRRVWETTAEVDAATAYSLLLGGPSAPNVAVAMNTPWLLPEPVPPAQFPAGTFDPATWNSFHVTVVNEDNTASAGSWQQLKIQ